MSASCLFSLLPPKCDPRTCYLGAVCKYTKLAYGDDSRMCHLFPTPRESSKSISYPSVRQTFCPDDPSGLCTMSFGTEYRGLPMPMSGLAAEAVSPSLFQASAGLLDLLFPDTLRH